ncbi:MAG: DUF4215 domain-containing protein [bacterium]
MWRSSDNRGQRACIVALALLLASGCGSDPGGGENNNELNNNAGGPQCGDGVVEGLEECDDGEANSDTTPDACRTDCVEARCGDGVTDTDEECDDGPGNSDGLATACRTDCSLPVCGDGVIDPAFGESCDDGNFAAGDGCNPDCQVEMCGNGIVDVDEVCDDGNVLAGDGCSPDCRSNETCGNGVVDVVNGEACDAGGANADTPNALCRTDCTPRRCGDGILDDQAFELCDDANTASGDGCSTVCSVEAHWVCTGQPSACACAPYFQDSECGTCVVFVDPSASITQRDGESWATAYAGLQPALDTAAAQGVPCEVWVVAGVYDIYQTSANDTILLRTNVALYGGFLGTETERTQRTWQTNVTQFLGTNVHRVFLAPGVSNARVDGITVTDAGFSLPGAALNATFSEVTLENCRLEQSYGIDTGGAIYAADTELTLTNVQIVQSNIGGTLFSLFGGAIFASDSTLWLTDVLVDTASGADIGGGLYATQCTVDIQSSRFELNQVGYYGGAIRAEDSDVTIHDSVFYNNVGGQEGGAVSAVAGTLQVTDSLFLRNGTGQGSGGAIHATNGPTLDNVRFVENSRTLLLPPSDGGGAVYTDGGATILGCTFEGNTVAGSGFGSSVGGIANVYSASVTNSWFLGNRASTRFAGLVNRYQLTQVANNVFAYNSAPDSTSLYAANAWGTTTTVTNCTFYANEATGGLWSASVANADTGDFALQNCILWGNSSPALVANGGTVTVAHSLVEGGWAGTGNLSVDPQLAGVPRDAGTGWTASSWDPTTLRTTFTDQAKAWTPGDLVGLVLVANSSSAFHIQQVHRRIAANTATAVEVYGDHTALNLATAYEIIDLRPGASSPAIDTADDSVATATDLGGNPRVDIAGVGTTGTSADMGAFEYQ